MTTPTDEVLVRVRGLTRRYGDVTALDGVDLDVTAGSLVGLLGPNGAGKSTLINLCTGLRRPHAGTVEVFGQDPQQPAARRSIGTTPQETGLPPSLRVGEVVDFVAAHFPDPVPRGELLEWFGLDGLARRQTGGLSGGQKRRLAVALAFAGRPRLVFLDEPTTGLDVDARRTLWDAIRDFHADGGTVVLTSHYLEEIEALAERVVVVDRGRVIMDGTVDDVRSSVHVTRVRFQVEDPASVPALPGTVSRADSPTPSRPGAPPGSSALVGGHVELVVEDADDAVRALVRADVAFRHLEIRESSLEEAFLALTAREPAPAGSDPTHPEVAR